jgi:hypothetical protein
MDTDTTFRIVDVGQQSLVCTIAVGFSLIAAQKSPGSLRKLCVVNSAVSAAALLGVIVALMSNAPEWLRHGPFVVGVLTFSYSIVLFVCSRRPPRTVSEYGYALWCPFVITAFIALESCGCLTNTYGAKDG